MMTWYSEHGRGWCAMMVNLPATVAFWGAVFTAMMLAVCFAIRQRSDPPARTNSGSTWPGGGVAAPIARGEMNDDDLHRRLM